MVTDQYSEGSLLRIVPEVCFLLFCFVFSEKLIFGTLIFPTHKSTEFNSLLFFFHPNVHYSEMSLFRNWEYRNTAFRNNLQNNFGITFFQNDDPSE